METSYSVANHAVLHAQNDRWGLEPKETCNFGAKVAVLNAKKHWLGFGPIETCNSGPKVAVLHAKATKEDWDPQRLVILVLNTLFFTDKMTGEVRDP